MISCERPCTKKTPRIGHKAFTTRELTNDAISHCCLLYNNIKEDVITRPSCWSWLSHCKVIIVAMVSIINNYTYIVVHSRHGQSHVDSEG